MLAEILEAIKVKREQFVFAGRKMICTEISVSQDLGLRILTDEDQKQIEEELAYRLAVRCVHFDEGDPNAGEPVFTDDDIEALKAASKTTLLPLFAVVRRVNGLDGDANAKK